jgi:hypothetical protein
MKLATLFQHLHSQAARTSRDQSADLSGGARIAVRFADGVTTFTIARKQKRVGDRELITFKNQCNVPASATRWPAEGQHLVERDGFGWWCVAFRWVVDEEDAPAEQASPPAEQASPPDPHNLTIYVCQLCDEEGDDFDTAAAFKAHVVEAHELAAADVEAAVGVSHMHMDYQKYFEEQSCFALADGRPLLMRVIRRRRYGK